ncbi:vWA domain-containing protein [Deinococcus yavapaiensis]|uniref:VWFA domain-containing protein n=1 Tax=Deinococcus yavapaiensis KR-236 TaxID=694435 RepID=A0A318S664_9DEIO|nr:VWA domain-containing protein [Deinococcus yavapaiensis]PYE54383.1 hypothetical protein DES52_10520 [Deinococcus yavapaiensis KR-236]
MTLKAPHADLARNVAAFAHELRSKHGYRVGSGEVQAALLALAVVDLGSLTRVRDALRPVLAASHEEARGFDAIFDAFFLPRDRMGIAQPNMPGFEPKNERPGKGKGAQEREADADQGGEGEEGGGRRLREDALEEGADDSGGSKPFLRARYSPLEVEGEPPSVRAERLAEMLGVATYLVSRLTLGRSRKWTPMQRGSRLDFRRTLRASLSRGGEVAHPHWKGHPRRNPRFVLILDGSRSMTPHTALMLQFAYALTLRARRVEVFFFSTELKRATPELRRMVRSGRTGTLPGFGAAWGGGTNIGGSLSSLVRLHPDLLSSETMTLILSDGLDVGEPDVLERAMRELKRRTASVVWLNPLLSTAGYEPTARGMRAALPFVDVFASANNLAALRALAARITMKR